MAEAGMRVTVVWAAPGEEDTTALTLPAGATIAQAVDQSGLADRRVGVAFAKVGVWGRLRPLEAPLVDGDRVEVYRPLVADPQTARRRRAAKKRAAARP
jgi:hypothetical protein